MAPGHMPPHPMHQGFMPPVNATADSAADDKGSPPKMAAAGATAVPNPGLGAYTGGPMAGRINPGFAPPFGPYGLQPPASQPAPPKVDAAGAPASKGDKQ